MIRFRQLIAAAAGAAAIAAQPVHAQIEKGDRSVSLQALLASVTGETKATFGMAVAALNVFQTRSFAWRVSLVENLVKADGETSTFTLIGAGVEWNFNREGRTTIPFIGVDVRHLVATDSDALTLVSPNGGMRLFMSRSTSFDVVGSYDMMTEDLGGDGIVQVRLGFSYYFGKDPRR